MIINPCLCRVIRCHRTGGRLVPHTNTSMRTVSLRILSGGFLRTDALKAVYLNASCAIGQIAGGAAVAFMHRRRRKLASTGNSSAEFCEFCKLVIYFVRGRVCQLLVLLCSRRAFLCSEFLRRVFVLHRRVFVLIGVFLCAVNRVFVAAPAGQKPCFCVRFCVRFCGALLRRAFVWRF